MLHFGALGVEIPIAVLSLALWLQVRTPGPVTKLACITGIASVGVGLLAWLVMRNENAAALGFVPVGLFAVLLIIAAARKEPLA